MSKSKGFLVSGIGLTPSRTKFKKSISSTRRFSLQSATSDFERKFCENSKSPNRNLGIHELSEVEGVEEQLEVGFPIAKFRRFLANHPLVNLAQLMKVSKRSGC